jgi:hypothetical protein
MSLFGDGLESVDLRNLNDVPLAKLGIQLNPNNRDEMFFLTDAGMGYGDIIRCAYYAKRLAEKYNKKCRIIFTILETTSARHIGSSQDQSVVFTCEEEAPKIAKVLSYYSKQLTDVTHTVVPMSEDDFYRYAYGMHVPFLLPTRSMAVTNWLGQPYLKPDVAPESGSHIAVWTTRHNLTPVASWKNPVGAGAMRDLCNTLIDQGHEIREVSYRDDMEYVFETIRTAKFCIGYEGMGNLISQSYKKPCLVYSTNEYHSKITSGMWAEVTSHYSISDKYIQDKIRVQQEIIRRGTPDKHNMLTKEAHKFYEKIL